MGPDKIDGRVLVEVGGGSGGDSYTYTPLVEDSSGKLSNEGLGTTPLDTKERVGIALGLDFGFPTQDGKVNPVVGASFGAKWAQGRITVPNASWADTPENYTQALRLLELRLHGGIEIPINKTPLAVGIEGGFTYGSESSAGSAGGLTDFDPEAQMYTGAAFFDPTNPSASQLSRHYAEIDADFSLRLLGITPDVKSPLGLDLFARPSLRVAYWENSFGPDQKATFVQEYSDGTADYADFTPTSVVRGHIYAGLRAYVRF